MKKIAIFIAVFCFSASVQAGLFEYHLGVSTPSNALSNADTVETVEQYQVPKYKTTYSNAYQGNDSRYLDNSLDHFYRNNTYFPQSNDHNNSLDHLYRNNTYFPQSNDRNIVYNNEFYRYDDIKDVLEDDLERLEREDDMINDIKREIKDEIRRLNKYSGSYYRDLKNQLEDNYDDLQDREGDVDEMINDLEDEIRRLSKYKGNSKSSNYNYYYNKDYYDSWSGLYNNRYDYYSNYNNRAYYKYDYDNNKYIPHWVNPDLTPIGEGHIYIR
jgi:hypothetical protein